MALWFDIQAVVTHSYRCWVFELACKLIRLTFKLLAAAGTHLNQLCDCLAKQCRALGLILIKFSTILPVFFKYLVSFALIFFEGCDKDCRRAELLGIVKSLQLRLQQQSQILTLASSFKTQQLHRHKRRRSDNERAADALLRWLYD